jgi:hypothetical protein
MKYLMAPIWFANFLEPDPWCVRFLLPAAPPFIGFRFQSRHPHRCGPGWVLGMEIIGTSRQTFHHKVQEPRETPADGTANPTERDTLASEMFDLHALLVENAAVQGVGGALAMARFTLLMLFAMAGMTIFFVSGDPHAGHASLLTIAAGDSLLSRWFLTNSSTESRRQHYLCSTTRVPVVRRL